MMIECRKVDVPREAYQKNTRGYYEVVLPLQTGGKIVLLYHIVEYNNKLLIEPVKKFYKQLDRWLFIEAYGFVEEATKNLVMQAVEAQYRADAADQIQTAIKPFVDEIPF
jgi:hypothetical protein